MLAGWVAELLGLLGLLEGVSVGLVHRGPTRSDSKFSWFGPPRLGSACWASVWVSSARLHLGFGSSHLGWARALRLRSFRLGLIALGSNPASLHGLAWVQLSVVRPSSARPFFRFGLGLGAAHLGPTTMQNRKAVS